jgi:hypothetical protein
MLVEVSMSLLLLNKKRKTASSNPDPYWDNVVLYLKGDGANNSTTFTDSSNSSKSISRSGDTQISTAQSKYGGSSIYFDGTGDGLTVPDSEDWNFTGDFTVESWIYATAFKNFGIIVGQHGGFGQSSNRSFCLRQDSSQRFEILRSFDGTNVVALTNSSNFILNTWYHLAVTRQGSTYKLFVDGIQVATDTNASSLYNSTYPLSIGSAQNFTDNWQGYIDSLRITKGTARYTANFNPETDTYLAY